MIEKLDNSNFILYCAKYYDSANLHNTEEFYEDLRRIKYIKKLITRYIENKELKERLILNHIIVLNNVFGPIHLSKILFLKMENQMKYIKPFLVFLNIMPEKIYNVGRENRIIHTDDIPMDQNIIDKLRKI